MCMIYTIPNKPTYLLLAIISPLFTLNNPCLSQVAPGSIVDVSTLKGCVQESAGDAPNTTTTAETATTTTTTTATTTSATVVVIDDIETEVTKAAVTVTWRLSVL